MDQKTKRLYEFDSFRLDPVERQLRRNEKTIPLTPKAFDTLQFLVENSGHLIEKEELMKRLWPDSFVEEVNLASNISLLRKTLGEAAPGEQFIETVAKRGYRFVAEVREIEASVPSRKLRRIEADPLGQNPEQEPSLPYQPASAQERVPLPQTQDAELQPSASHSGDQAGEPRSASFKSRRSAALIWLAVAISAGLAVYIWVSRSNQPVKARANSIAVLPFKSMGSGENDQILGVGMADSIISKLSKLNQVLVRPTTSISRYQGDWNDPVLVAKELQVESLLVGTIRRAEDRIRVTAQLINSDGQPIWAEKFDEKFTGVFSVEDRISARVAESLPLELTDEARHHLVKRYTQDPEAYLLYLRGFHHLVRRTGPEILKSIPFFKQAVSKDERYALAYASLSLAYESLAVIRWARPSEVMPQAKKAVLRAVEIDNQLPEAHAMLGIITYEYDWDFALGEQEMKLALKLDPSSTVALRQYAYFLADQQRFEESLDHIRQVIRLEPLSAWANRDLGAILYWARRYDAAIEQLLKTVELDPNFPHTYSFLSLSYTQKGLYDLAVENSLIVRRIYGFPPEVLATLKKAYQTQGWKGYVRATAKDWEERARRRYISNFTLASDYARLEETGKALDALERACDEREPWMTTLNIDPLLDGLRSEPRFVALQRRVGLRH